MASDMNERILECILCPIEQFKFMHTREVKEHNNKYHRVKVSQGDKIVRCIKCPNTEFGKDVEITEHMENHHPTLFQLHRCCYCTFGTRDMTHLILHKRAMHATIPHFTCSYCFTKLFRRKELMAHISREHPESDKICKKCNKSFRDEHSMKLHMMDMHDIKSKSKYGTILAPRTNIKPKEDFVEVMENARNESIFGCSQCPNYKPVNELHNFWKHLRSEHKGDQSVTQCANCQQIFKSVKDVNKHVVKVHGNVYRPFRCHVCRFGCDGRATMVNHNLEKVNTVTKI